LRGPRPLRRYRLSGDRPGRPYRPIRGYPQERGLSRRPRNAPLRGGTCYRPGDRNGRPYSPTKKLQIEEIQVQADAVAIETKLELLCIHLCLARAVAVGNGNLVEVDRIIRIADDVGKEL